MADFDCFLGILALGSPPPRFGCIHVRSLVADEARLLHAIRLGRPGQSGAASRTLALVH